MRTKTLLLAAAALSAGVLAASAQVYSANVVGYVNTEFKPGNTLWCNPLTNSLGSSLAVLFPKCQDNATISRWSNADATWLPGAATFYSDVPNGYATGVWDDAGITSLAPGEGFLLFNPGPTFTNTFVGDVLQGSLTITIPPGGSMLGSKVPIGGPITNVLAGLTLPDASTVQTFDNGQGVFNTQAATYYDLGGGSGVWDPENYPIGVGEGFYLINSGSQVDYTRTFTVQ